MLDSEVITHSWMLRATATIAVLTLSACGGGGGGSGSSSGGVNPPPANAAPTIQAQAFSGTEDAVLTGQLAASDPGDTITYAVAANPTGGAVAITTAGAFTYTPNANFNGTDTFQARVTDSAAQSATAVVTVTLASVPDTVAARDDVFTVTATDSLAVLANDNDVDGAALTVAVIGAPLVGTATVGARGVISLAMPAGFKGMTRFDYRVTDAGGVASTAHAVVFVGVAPFKAIFHGRSLDDPLAPMGIYVNDFLRSYRAHPSLAPATLQQARYSANGRAIMLVVDFAGTGEKQVRYVELDHPDVMRDVSPRLPFSDSLQAMAISSNGRYVVYQLRNGTTGSDTLWLFDAQAAGMAAALTDPAVLYQTPQVAFNGTDTRIYFVGRQQPTPSTSTNAVYRADLATRVITRVTPLIPGTSGAIDSFLVTPTESRLVATRALTGIPRSIYVSDPAQPDLETLLHEPLTNPDFTSIPVLSPNGATLLMQVSHAGLDPSQVRLADPLAPGTTVAVGPTLFQQSATYSSTDRPFLMRADSLASLIISGCDTVHNPGGSCDIYEITFGSPSAPVRVNVAAPPGVNVGYPKYSRDGERIAYMRRNAGNAGAVLQLHVTRRQALGAESIEVSPPDQTASYYVLDPDGYTAMVALPGNEFSLVNLDGPQLMLPVGEGLDSIGAWALLPR
ncbi:MAG: Ig-like domain-containing protein [Pseudomonadota bacterium]